MMSLPIKQSLCDMEDHDPSLTAVLECPKKMVGRVIGKGGETIKALQQYTGAVIQIDQSQDPTCVTIAGKKQSLHLAVSMIKVGGRCRSAQISCAASNLVAENHSQGCCPVAMEAGRG